MSSRFSPLGQVCLTSPGMPCGVVPPYRRGAIASAQGGFEVRPVPRAARAPGGSATKCFPYVNPVYGWMYGWMFHRLKRVMDDASSDGHDFTDPLDVCRRDRQVYRLQMALNKHEAPLAQM